MSTVFDDHLALVVETVHPAGIHGKPCLHAIGVVRKRYRDGNHRTPRQDSARSRMIPDALIRNQHAALELPVVLIA